MRMRKIRIYLQNMRIIRIYSQNCTYLYVIELYLCIISYYIAIVLQINANFMWIFIIRMRMRMQNFVSMRISHRSKKCYEISHILGVRTSRFSLTTTTSMDESGLHWTSTFLPSCFTDVVDLRWLMMGTQGLTYQIRIESLVNMAVRILSRLQITWNRIRINRFRNELILIC